MFEGIGPNYKIIQIIRQIFQGCGYICRTCFIRKVNNILNTEADRIILVVFDTDNYSSMCKSNVPYGLQGLAKNITQYALDASEYHIMH